MPLPFFWMVFLNSPTFPESLDDSAWQQSHPAVESKRLNQNSVCCMSEVNAGGYIPSVGRRWGSQRVMKHWCWLTCWSVFILTVQSPGSFPLLCNGYNCLGQFVVQSVPWPMKEEFRNMTSTCCPVATFREPIRVKTKWEMGFRRIWVMGGKREMRMRL